MGMRAQDCPDRAASDQREDRVDDMRSVDDDALGVVANHPDVVLDLERLPVERERPGGHRLVDPGGQGVGTMITTDRSSSPPCILSKAASMSLMPISSVTKHPAAAASAGKGRSASGSRV